MKIVLKLEMNYLRNQFLENDLYMMTKVMYKLKKVPLEIKNENILLTPVDDLAKAILTLMSSSPISFQS